MKHTFKLEKIEKLSEKEADKIVDLLEEIAIDIEPNFEHRIEAMECRRREGFMPNPWNLGGIQSCLYTDLYSVVCSNDSSGSVKFDDKIQEYINYNSKLAIDKFIEDKNLPNNFEFKRDGTDENLLEELAEYESEYFSDDSSSICIEYQGRYLGYNKGIHTISLNIFLCASDAPYHRKSDDDLEIVISFRDIDSKNFRNKINKAIEQLRSFIGYCWIDFY